MKYLFPLFQLDDIQNQMASKGGYEYVPL